MFRLSPKTFAALCLTIWAFGMVYLAKRWTSCNTLVFLTWCKNSTGYGFSLAYQSKSYTHTHTQRSQFWSERMRWCYLFYSSSLSASFLHSERTRSCLLYKYIFLYVWIIIGVVFTVLTGCSGWSEKRVLAVWIGDWDRMLHERFWWMRVS